MLVQRLLAAKLLRKQTPDESSEGLLKVDCCYAVRLSSDFEDALFLEEEVQEKERIVLLWATFHLSTVMHLYHYVNPHHQNFILSSRHLSVYYNRT